MFDEAVARDMLTLIDGSLVYIGETAPLDAPGTATHHHGESKSPGLSAAAIPGSPRRRAQTHGRPGNPALGVPCVTKAGGRNVGRVGGRGAGI